MLRIHLIVLILFVNIFNSDNLSASIIFVNIDATGANNGTSWPNAFTSLSSALNIATINDSIWIAQGIYSPTDNNDRYISFNISNGAKMFGGFNGVEIFFEERDWLQFPTILSGNIGEIDQHNDNSFTILHIEPSNTTTIIDGIIFQDGNANSNVDLEPFNSPSKSGGAIYIDISQVNNSNIIISNCKLSNNYSSFFGGAIQASGNSGFTFLNCTFIGNVAGFSGGAINKVGGCSQELNIIACDFFENISGGFGGGINTALTQCNFNLNIKNCNFNNNSSDTGGAFSKTETQLNSTSNTKIIESIFNSNFASSSGAAIYDIGFIQGDLEIDQTLFSNNYGSSIILYENGNLSNLFKISNSTFSKNEHECVFFNSNLISQNNFFYKNKATCFIKNSNFLATNNYFINNNFYDNVNSLGLFNLRSSQNHIINSIFWDNHSDIDDVFHINNNVSLNVINSFFNESNVDSIGYFALEPFGDSTSTIEFLGQNQFGIYPEFRDTANSDFTLRSCSPAVNAGDNSLIDNFLIETDIRGFPRKLNDIVDIGAYEQYAIDLGIKSLQDVTCKGFNDGEIELFLSGLTPFNLSSPSITMADTVNTSLGAGIYTFYLEDSDQCIDSINIEINEADSSFQISETILSNVDCFGDSTGQIILEVTGGALPYTFLWSDSISEGIREELVSGIYHLTLSDENQCTIIDSFEITESLELSVNFNSNNTPTGLQNGSIAIESINGGTQPYEYQWSNGATSEGIGGLDAGEYSLTITDGANCVYNYNFNIDFISALNNINSVKHQITPNPTFESVILILDPAFNPHNYELYLYDFSGKQLYKKSLSLHQTEIKLEKLPTGLYPYQITNPLTGHITSGRIIKF